MTSTRFDLTRIPIVKRIVTGRWLQWLAVTAALSFFFLAILAGLFGTPAGNRNFGIVFVWIVWWALVIMLMVPFAGRLWCAICPIPVPGEWLQRRALVQPRPGARLYTFGLKWPKWLNNMWFQNGAFLGVALFSAVILTTPFITGVVLALFALVALGTSLLFERRTFCRYLCPVGGFIGLYSQVAPVEVRVKDRAVCVGHKDKSCYQGSEAGYGCPWLVFPGALQKNTYCGMCMECLKTCPLDNVAVYVRPFGADLQIDSGRRLDESYKGFIMLTCALAYSVVLIGPWSILKEAAFAVGTPAWFVYALTFLVANLALIPGMFYGCVRLAQKIGPTSTPTGKLLVEYAYALVPLGLAAWAAFSLSFILVNLSYVWPVLSDPFGWGWDLFGTTAWGWTPYGAGLVPHLQTPVLIAGLIAAIAYALRTTQAQRVTQWAALPIILFCAMFTLTLLWLYIG